MDPAPKALRPFLLLSTAFVLMGTAAGALLFLMARPETRAALPAPAPDDAEAETRALPWPASVPAAQRDPFEAALQRLVQPTSGGQAEPEARLRDAGGIVVPRLLTYLHEIASDPKRPDDRIERLRFIAVERVLTALRWELTPGDLPSPRARFPDGAYVRRRARQWFAWWDRAGAALVR